jgi:23S rRNA pseudouridine1911/1915/1917 synthase
VARRRDPFEQRDEAYRALHEGIARPAGVAPEAVMRVLRVPPELAGMRLDRFIARELRATSRTRSQLIVRAGAYTPDGTALKKNRRLAADQRVVLWRPPWDEEGLDADLPVVFEDASLLAINKPPSVAVHPTARHHRSTVAMQLAAQRPDERLTLLHRLDRETSGVLLLARTRAADRLVKQQFEERSGVIKRYLAITWGAPAWDRHTCDLPLEPDPGPLRVKMRVAAPGAGLPSATSFEVLGRGRKGEAGYSLLRCTLHTGRQHQIRVHLAALGLPIVGDKLYGPDEGLFTRGADGHLDDADRARLELPRHALHAGDLTIDHPETGERLTIEAPLYPDLQAFWDGLER